MLKIGFSPQSIMPRELRGKPGYMKMPYQTEQYKSPLTPFTKGGEHRSPSLPKVRSVATAALRGPSVLRLMPGTRR